MPAGKTYEPITTTTVNGSSTTTVALTNIPQTFTDLILVTDIKTTNNNNGNGWITFNSDTGTNYSQTRMYGGSSNTYGSDRQTSTNYINLNIGGANNGIITVTAINNYISANMNKTVLVRVSTPNQYVGLNVGMWRNTSAITRIDVTIHEGYINSGSTITLYGIKAA